MMHLLLVLIALGCLAAPAAAQTSPCADCHLANVGSVGSTWTSFAITHLDQWDHSPHGRGGVGCHSCHGGDPTTFERVQAHRGMLPRANPASPVNRRNLTRTCGTCHAGPLVQFQKSRHYDLVLAGDERGPTCTTCHGEVATHLRGPSALASTCNGCHAERRTHPRPDFGPDARLMSTDLRAVRELLDQARGLVRRVRDGERRAALERQLQQAEVPLVEARQAVHQFVFEDAHERVEVARTRAQALLDQLANLPAAPR